MVIELNDTTPTHNKAPGHWNEPGVNIMQQAKPKQDSHPSMLRSSQLMKRELQER